MIAVDMYGQCADYDPLLTACDRYGVPLIEDAAEALGATYRGRPAGSFGLAGVLSFNGNKIITTGGGGMLVTDDGRVADADPAPGHPGPRAGAALRAPHGRLQLPAQQPARRGRPRPAAAARRPDRRPPGDRALLPGRARRPARR